VRLAREARAPRRDTIGDATVAAPPRWHVEQRADRVTFTEPDRALRVTIVGNAGADAATAIAAAWQLAEPGFALAPGQPDEMPDSGDWDAVTTIEYRPPTSEHRTAIVTERASGCASRGCRHYIRSYGSPHRTVSPRRRPRAFSGTPALRRGSALGNATHVPGTVPGR